MEQDENEKAQKIQIIAFVTNEKSHPPNDIINSYYLISYRKYCFYYAEKEQVKFDHNNLF